MDGSQFDDLVKRVVSTRATRLTALRGLAVGTLASLAGLSLSADLEAKNKNKKKRRKRKKPVCTCSTTGCTQQKVKKPQNLINQNPRCNYAGTCTTNPCAAPLGCSPATNTQQGSCQLGQICSAQAICVAGCTATTGNPQGSCPAGQVCVVALNQITGTCRTVAICNPACTANQICCPVGTAAAGLCRGNLQAC